MSGWGGLQGRESTGGIEPWEVDEILASLTEKSLVLPVDSGRWRLLETVRDYGRGQLADAGESADIGSRHLSHFTALAEEANPHLTGADQQAWLEQLEAEHGNVRAALAWSTEGANDQESCLRLVGAIWRFWYVRGHFREGREHLETILALDMGVRTSLRAKALNAAGTLAWGQSDYASARALQEESLAIFRELGDREGIARLLNNLGNVAYDLSDYAATRALYEESLAIFRELGDRMGIAASLSNLGNVAQEQADYATARPLYEESLSIRRALGERGGIANSLNNLGSVAFELSDYTAARALSEESLAICRELGNQFGIASSVGNLGCVALGQSDYAVARAHFVEMLAINRELGDRRGIALSLEGLAALTAALGGPARAARLWGRAERLREEIGSPLTSNDRGHYEPQVEAARTALSDDALFYTAWEEGRAMTMEQAVGLALENGG